MRFLSRINILVTMARSTFHSSTSFDYANKKVVLHLTVHTVHLEYFSFYIIKLGSDELVKSEQSTLHFCDFCSFWIRSVRRYAGGQKVFLGFTVHLMRRADSKRPAVAGQW